MIKTLYKILDLIAFIALLSEVEELLIVVGLRVEHGVKQLEEILVDWSQEVLQVDWLESSE